jgi:hypothetical protein
LYGRRILENHDFRNESSDGFYLTCRFFCPDDGPKKLLYPRREGTRGRGFSIVGEYL